MLPLRMHPIHLSSQPCPAPNSKAWQERVAGTGEFWVPGAARVGAGGVPWPGARRRLEFCRFCPAMGTGLAWLCPQLLFPSTTAPPPPTQCLSLGYTTFAPTQGVCMGVSDCDCASKSGPRQCCAPHLLSFKSGLKTSLGRGTESSVPPQLLGHSP